jgi:membrane-associated HD superfamily phosphohydrolase
MKRIINAIIVVFGFALAISACTAPPTEQMQKARDAVTRAENDADAVTYAGNSVVHARDALTRMQEEADSKNYDTAKEFAIEAINSAEKAIADGQYAKERSKAEASALLDSVQNSLAETSNAINNAKNVPNIPLDFDAITQETGEARETYDEAQQSFQDGNNPDAIAKGQSVRGQLSDINTKINEAAFDTSRKQ